MNFTEIGQALRLACLDDEEAASVVHGTLLKARSVSRNPEALTQMLVGFGPLRPTT